MRFFSKTLDKLKGALRKTKDVLQTDVRTLFIPGRQIDDAFLAETEEKLAEMMELTKQTIEEDAREWLKFSEEVQKSAMTSSALN